MTPARLYGSTEARALHAEAPPVDLHADPLLWTRKLGYDLNRRHRPPLPRALYGGHVDVPRLRDGGVGAVFFGLVSLPGLDMDLAGAVSEQVDLLEHAAQASSGRLRLARTAQDVADAARDGAVAALMGIEGAHCLGGGLDRLERYARRGVRYLGLLHFSRNACGSPAFGWGARTGEGLTGFGRQVIERCEELGVIVDLAHINKRGFMDACEVARLPVIVSHTGVAGVHDLWRNIDDDELRALAEKGGVAGVMFCPHFLGRDGIDAVVDHLAHIVKVAGEDTPALGSDWDGLIRPTRGLEEACKLPCLTDAMLARGMPRALVRKILRDNALRVITQVPARM